MADVVNIHEAKTHLSRLVERVELVPELVAVGMDVLSITAGHATIAARLPLHHRDPFDRWLVTQARRLDAIVVTRDTIFERYEAERLPV
ncbi:MAG TPA: PIN domain-containing protein [Candidatus Limnocylindrales bacterium]|nr:PIN domain-containing protein [Candidatus Limnocylindrales bacterium]